MNAEIQAKSTLVESRSPVLSVIPTVLNATMCYLIVLTTLIVSRLGQFGFGHDFQINFKWKHFLSLCSSGIKWTHFGNIYCGAGIFVAHREVNIKVTIKRLFHVALYIKDCEE